MTKIESLINTYKPDKIILELGPDAAPMAFRSFHKFRYKFLIFPMLKFRQKFLRKSSESNVGRRWMYAVQRLSCVLPASYAAVMATDIAMNNERNEIPISIICADYPQKNMVPMLAFAEAMDVYQAAFYKK